MNIRNKPCPCGSKKKAKRCCFNEAVLAKQRQDANAAMRPKITIEQDESQ